MYILIILTLIHSITGIVLYINLRKITLKFMEVEYRINITLRDTCKIHAVEKLIYHGSRNKI